MIDPLLSLAFAMQTNKGVYALMVGSGVSRAAQIPTGWEIVLDLIEKLAHIQGEDCGSDPGLWYRAKYGAEPDYSELLDAIAKSQTERQQLLSAYFEPNEEEREQGFKLPTDAHRAIASLVSGGYVRVILTTNFDRLIERAIEDEGITPTVLSTPDAVKGALPLAHQKCVVVKVHGDYLDTRIKNTPDELSVYDDSINDLLDRILDEFGFVVCGWSAQWDTALCAAFERCKSRRFTMYWANRGKVTDRAERLLQNRGGIAIPITDADSFFTELAEKVISLEQFQQPHPLSVAAAAATVKRLIADERHIIRLHDLVVEETERVVQSLQPVFSELLGSGEPKEMFKKGLSGFCSRLEVLRAVAMYGSFWGRVPHERMLSAILPRLANDPEPGKGGVHLNNSLRVIPSVITFYTMGMAATANANWGMLVAMAKTPALNGCGDRQSYLTTVEWIRLQHWFKLLPEYERKHFPASEWLFEACRETLRPLIPDDTDYERLFDLFEIIRSLVYADIDCGGQVGKDGERLWGPPGRFVWKSANRLGFGGKDFLEEIKTDDDLVAGLAKAGLFGGKDSAVCMAIDKFKSCVAKMGQRCF